MRGLTLADLAFLAGLQVAVVQHQEIFTDFPVLRVGDQTLDFSQWSEGAPVLQGWIN